MPDLPELFKARAVADSDPFQDAIEQAEGGCDAGLFCFDPASADVKAALVLAPEVPLSNAMVMIPLCAVAFYDAATMLVGAEDDLRLDWNGGLRFGDELRGQVRVAAPGQIVEPVPDWLVIGLNAQLGVRPDAAYPDPFEGVAPNYLLELWARRIFDEISHWSSHGAKRLRQRWSSLSRERRKQVNFCGHEGKFRSVNKNFDAQIETDGQSRDVAMVEMLIPATP